LRRRRLLEIDTGETRTADDILSRAGWVLFVVQAGAALQIALWPPNVSLHGDVLLLLAGIFLIQRSIRAVGPIQWIAVLMATASALSMLAGWFSLPPALLFAKLHNVSSADFWGAALSLVEITVLFWLVSELGQPAIIAARLAAGKAAPKLALPALIGVAVVLIGAGIGYVATSSEDAKRARQAAAQAVGAEYQLHVASISYVKGSGKTTVKAEVTAWQGNDIRTVSAQWVQP
jgi:hypothetical protein